MPPGAAPWETEKDSFGELWFTHTCFESPRTTKATFPLGFTRWKHPLLYSVFPHWEQFHAFINRSHWLFLFSGDTLHTQRWSPYAGASVGAALSCQMSLHETERGQLKFGVWTMGILKGLEKWATTGPPPPSCVRGYHLLRYFCFRNKEAFMFEAHI